MELFTITRILVSKLNKLPSNMTVGEHLYMREGNLDVLNSNFSSNNCSGGRGGAISVNGVEAKVTITNTFFNDNGAENGYNRGGAVYVSGGNVTVTCTNSTFINNSASGGGGGAISTSFYANVSLINNIFSHNSAAYCGAIEIFEFYCNQVSLIGNNFIYNRAVQQISGNNEGGVICIKNASVTVSNNNFSHNSATWDAGVMQVDESDIIN